METTIESTKQKEVINVMWFKRDLRLRDNPTLAHAIKETSKTKGRRLLLIYIYEPSLVANPHYDERHWRFVFQSLTSINSQLKVMKKAFDPQFIVNEYPNIPNIKIEESVEQYKADPAWCINIFMDEVIAVFEELRNEYELAKVFSHKETGMKITYDRDIAFATLCKNYGIQWNEYTNNGIIRKIKDRSKRYERWKSIMNEPQMHPDFSLFKPLVLTDEISKNNPGEKLPESWKEENTNFQLGGEKHAFHYLNIFLKNNLKNYTISLSKPLESRTNCSRISPYLAWGCISTRQVFQAITEVKRRKAPGDKILSKELNLYSNRLMCQGSFVQSFENKDNIEFEDVNKFFSGIKKNIDQQSFERWCNGQTGYPLADASMRCLAKTGFVNFRMRAFLISFLTHHLFQDWKEGAKHLAKLFLDFEPGIHFSQMQLQSGMGSHQIVRVYNPVKQSQDHDPKGIFIKQWIPELANCDEADIHEPWKMSLLQQQFCGVIIGEDYPFPIVDAIKTGKEAREILFEPRLTNKAGTKKPPIKD
ncbi:cryptochrome/deoxyribodipyrimidine photo-lyase family protein [Flavobacterium turcicum]|uniref:Deoxyribodipyrimidine photo-lyase n=1 Tax=Flavobacterium turcicum TaxID=2764718 RepID=A0ABR7JE88_9FLAO|nr:FAD-binding domain-containing protein [Flavobacterium turcicum]MBC5862797.1 deoxyribodipyrimidine photo-lyase [Flavobacterium turcicum]NHL01529.1 deoxyribodipyrimidine photolyase [Flavobacterium turcicum]